ncbi:MAG TPA: class I SAM-dependent methyltransferase [Gemmatimonadaceae bacterium]|nr:class I SAM-dependent methyltransferase [Gemmatimonadaceae bacterium]
MTHSQQTLTQQSYSDDGRSRKDAGALAAARAVIEDVFGPVASRRFAVRFWDGTSDEPAEEPRFTIVLESPGALRRMLLPPSELALTESYIFGDVDIEGDLEAAADLGDVAASRLRSPRALLRLARHVMALPRDETENSADRTLTRSTHLSGRRHSRRRDREAVRFHYNVGNAFYALWLDAKMVYSCAYFARETDGLDQAQESKLDHICRKLRLTPGERLLDIGCGWGGLIMHAARRYGVFALGITLSDAQAETARERIAAAGLGDRCHVELRDYRQLAREPRFDKISSVGMVEHVGAERLDDYFASAWGALRPGGLFLNHGIVSIAASRPESRWSRVAGRVWKRGEFIDRYVFPDGELVPSATVIASAEKAGFELRDVESLREHYVQTLGHWVHRLESHRDEAIALVGEPTYRVWRLYMSASAYGFRTGRIGIIQSLLAKPYADGRVELPRTREDLYRRA